MKEPIICWDEECSKGYPICCYDCDESETCTEFCTNILCINDI